MNSCAKALHVSHVFEFLTQQAATSNLNNAALTKIEDVGMAAQTASGLYQRNMVWFLSGLIPSLVDSANQAAAACQNADDKIAIINATRDVAEATSRMINAAKILAINKQDEGAKGNFLKCASLVAGLSQYLYNLICRRNREDAIFIEFCCPWLQRLWSCLEGNWKTLLLSECHSKWSVHRKCNTSRGTIEPSIEKFGSGNREDCIFSTDEPRGSWESSFICCWSKWVVSVLL